MSRPRDMRFTFLACADLRRMLDAISMPADMWGVTGPENLARAQAFTHEFARHCELLAANPELGSARDELIHQMRSSNFQKCTIFYRVRGDSLEVVRVLRAARDSEPLG